MRASRSVPTLWLLLVPVLAAGAAPPPAATPAIPSSDIYKCSGPDGVPVYQEGPCAAGRELRNFATDPGSVSVIPFKNPDRTSTTPPARSERATRGPATMSGAKTSGSDPAERRHLREGMTEAEVMVRVGAPDITSGKSGKVRWSYLPVPADPATITTLRFEHGKVVAVERKVVR